VTRVKIVNESVKRETGSRGKRTRYLACLYWKARNLNNLIYFSFNSACNDFLFFLFYLEIISKREKDKEGPNYKIIVGLAHQGLPRGLCCPLLRLGTARGPAEASGYWAFRPTIHKFSIHHLPRTGIHCRSNAVIFEEK
jgi:hypothetical protein